MAYCRKAAVRKRRWEPGNNGLPVEPVNGMIALIRAGPPCREREPGAIWFY